MMRFYVMLVMLFASPVWAQELDQSILQDAPNLLLNDDMSDEEFMQLYDEKLLPMMEKMTEQIKDVMNSPAMQPPVQILAEKIYYSQIYQEDIAEHWDDLVEPLVMKYAADNKVVGVIEGEVSDDIMADLDAGIATEITQLEQLMAAENSSVEQVVSASESLDMLVKTQEQVSGMLGGLGGASGILQQAFVAAKQKQADYQAALDAIGATFGGDVIETAHGRMSLQALKAFLAEQIEAGNLAFLSDEYQAKFWQYIDDLKAGD